MDVNYRILPSGITALHLQQLNKRMLSREFIEEEKSRLPKAVTVIMTILKSFCFGT